MTYDANPELCTNGALCPTSAQSNTPSEVARGVTVLLQLRDLPQDAGQLLTTPKSVIITPL
jgi:hypothetical protein